MLHPGLTMTHAALPAQAILANMDRKSQRLQTAAPMQPSDTNLRPRHSPAIGVRLGTARNRPFPFTGGDLTSRQLGKLPLRALGAALRSHPREQSWLRSNFRERTATNGRRPVRQTCRQRAILATKSFRLKRVLRRCGPPWRSANPRSAISEYPTSKGACAKPIVAATAFACSYFAPSIGDIHEPLDSSMHHERGESISEASPGHQIVFGEVDG